MDLLGTGAGCEARFRSLAAVALGVSPAVPDRAEELLTSEPLVAHLATSHDDRPHVAPIWYVYRASEASTEAAERDEPSGVVEVATTGRKLRDLRHNPYVALSVQKDEDGSPQWGVSLRGTARVIEDEDDARETLRRINRKYGTDEDAWSENTSVRIDVGSVTHWEY